MQLSSSKTSLNSSIHPTTSNCLGQSVGTSYSCSTINKTKESNYSFLRKNISIQENNGILKSGMVTVLFQTSVYFFYLYTCHDIYVRQTFKIILTKFKSFYFKKFGWQMSLCKCRIGVSFFSKNLI